MAELVGKLVELEVLEQVIDSLGAHLCDELLGIVILELLVACRKLLEDVEILFL